jgi:ATP-dependent 26S proteasome regulatory subunit
LRLRCDIIIDADAPVVNKAAPTLQLQPSFSIPFEGIGGCEEAKSVLSQVCQILAPHAASFQVICTQAIVWPQTRAADFQALGTRAITGIVLYGPPGCGKTSIARAVAATAPHISFFSIAAPDIVSPSSFCGQLPAPICRAGARFCGGQ